MSVGMPPLAVSRLGDGVHHLQHLAAAGAQGADDRHGNQAQEEQVQDRCVLPGRHRLSEVERVMGGHPAQCFEGVTFSKSTR